MDRYEYVSFNKGTHYPYSDFLPKSELYPYYIKSHEPIRTKNVTMILNGQKFRTGSGTYIPPYSSNPEYKYYQFIAYTSYSDDYDQY